MHDGTMAEVDNTMKRNYIFNLGVVLKPKVA